MRAFRVVSSLGPLGASEYTTQKPVTCNSASCRYVFWDYLD